MSNTDPNSPVNPEMEKDMDQSSSDANDFNQEDIDAATIEAMANADNIPAAEELSSEEQQAAEIADLKEKLLRALAETENMRRRSQKEKEDAHNFAISKFARDMLNMSDNLRRAINAVSEDDLQNEAVKTLLTGIEMTESELLNTFSKHKIKVIDAAGKKFDPNFHQAMFEIENPDVEPGTILQVVQDGFIIADRLLRPAMVGIAKGGQKKTDSHLDTSA